MVEWSLKLAGLTLLAACETFSVPPISQPPVLLAAEGSLTIRYEGSDGRTYTGSLKEDTYRWIGLNAPEGNIMHGSPQAILLPSGEVAYEIDEGTVYSLRRQQMEIGRSWLVVQCLEQDRLGRRIVTRRGKRMTSAECLGGV
ncbi:hypothetical protein [Parvularcula oceani]|uniref:hypothetical protein n=1 Tax=Parvularcula oceani TaxID=1247963 RepID=UPI0012DE080F|nr:hypothetical protein [Parvularcula oceani]